MGRTEFDAFYSQIYGSRWESLRESLLHNRRVCFSLNDREASIRDLPSPQEGQVIPRAENNLLKYYVLDPASVLIARALPLTEGARVLDMCAAPGGKSLVLFSRLSVDSEITLNEVSPGRREALTKVIQNYIPMEQRQSRLWIKGLDGAQFGLRMPAQFDSILLDAPCSGEAHLLENQKELQLWKKKRTQGLSIKQYSLLSSAWSSVKAGGYILYSTCSISPLENDEVIQKLVDRKKNEFEIIQPDFEIEPERTKYGFQYLPDRAGMGPLFGCLIRKNPEY